MIDHKISEQAVVACALMDAARVMPAALELLTPDDFQVSPCRTLFTICRDLYMQSIPIDVITVMHELGDRQGEREEYKKYIAELAQTVPTVSNFKQYISFVSENSRRTKSLGKCFDLQSGLAGDLPLDDCQTIAADLAQGMSTARGDCLSAAEGFAAVVKSLDEPRNYIKTGFSSVDRFVYFDRGDFMVIGGRPSSGKTALSLQMVLNVAREHNVIYFSLETSVKKIYDRLVACHTLTPFDEINAARVQDREQLLRNQELFSQLKLHVVNASGWTVSQIKAKAMQLRADIIFVDYIGLVKAPGKSLYERTTCVSNDLHILAQQSHIAVVGLSQLNREGANDVGDPNMSNLRESGAVEQDADSILLLNAPKPSKGKPVSPCDRDLIIAKNKTGRTGKLRMNFNGNLQRFAEICEQGESGCRPF